MDISAHVRPRKRLMNMRMLMRMAMLEGVKPVESCVPVTGTAEGVTEVLLFGWDWATSWVRSATVALPLSGRSILYVSMMNAATTAENKPVYLEGESAALIVAFVA